MKREAAFSLLEVLLATAITAGVGAAAFRLFHQNERLYRDQALILEMQQNARIVVSQVADDIRQAGQAIPRTFNDVILPGSGSSRLNLRTGFSAVESIVTSPSPLTLSPGGAVTVGVETTLGFSSGRQAFFWNETEWARATISSVSGISKSVVLVPSATSKAPLVFLTLPALSLDEAASTYRDELTSTVRRTTSTNTENPESPAWAPANELASNVSALTFIYYDAMGDALSPDTSTLSSAVSIETRITVRSSASLSDRSRPTFSLAVRVFLRNRRAP